MAHQKGKGHLSRCPELLNLFGGDEGDRTPDLMNAIHALSQLSYIPFCFQCFSGIYKFFQFMNSGFLLKPNKKYTNLYSRTQIPKDV